MDEVIIELPSVNFSVHQGDTLISYWASFASLPMVNDDVVYWQSKGKAKFIQKVFNKLEEDIGVDFERVKRPKRAEIMFKKVKKFDNPDLLGSAHWTPEDPRWKITIATKFKNRRSTVVHEIGHALGLGHPEDHAIETDTIMSYNRDRKSRYFYPKDIDYLTGLYINV